LWSDWSTPTFFTTLTTTPPPVPPQPGQGGCFIASVCFGESSWQVKILKEFRDRYLLKNNIGKNFVRFYYAHSPEIAETLRENKPLSLLVKILLYPVILIVYILLNPLLIYLISCVTVLTIFTVKLKNLRKKFNS
jgi:hypothetical protein